MRLSSRLPIVATLAWCVMGSGLMAQDASPGEPAVEKSPPAEAAAAPPAPGLPPGVQLTVEAAVSDPPATLTAWNRDIVTFRATLTQTPELRARGAAERIRGAEDDREGPP